MTTRSVFPVMGTMCTIVVAESDVARMGDVVARAGMAAARGQLELMDHRFSHYSRESEISRWTSGLDVSPDALADIDFVIRQCLRLRDESDGVFVHQNPVTKSMDTAGYVKGYAILLAVRAMKRNGLRNFIVGVGGDTFCAGVAGDDRPWRVGVSDPARSHGVVALVDATDLAVATSGRAERGEHIWNGSAQAKPEILSFSVIGPDIAEADAYATIGYAMGERGIDWVAGREGYRSLVVRTDGSLVGDAALVSVA
ncbi:MAG: FAD:protein FMN transferase [Actinobacteria bacterium]|nr:FAD:protein FMN transferase [Actinomycetota bacterium]